RLGPRCAIGMDRSSARRFLVRRGHGGHSCRCPTHRRGVRGMNVLMPADAVGGVWTYALELCRALSVHGVDVALATMGPEPTEPQRAQAERLTNVTLHCTSYRLEWMDDPWDDVACAGAWLLALAARERIDLVHLNGFAHAALPWRKPVIVVRSEEHTSELQSRENL